MTDLRTSADESDTDERPVLDHDPSDQDGLHRYRAPSFDEALASASAELGDVDVVQANRIRRGGLGGFFATDLGVELTVSSRPETTTGDDNRSSEVSHAVDHLLGLIAENGGDRFTPSGHDEHSEVHPFADRLEQEMRAMNELSDSTAVGDETTENPRIVRAQPRPDRVADDPIATDTVTAPTVAATTVTAPTVAAEPHADDPMADIDELLRRAGVDFHPERADAMTSPPTPPDAPDPCPTSDSGTEPGPLTTAPSESDPLVPVAVTPVTERFDDTVGRLAGRLVAMAPTDGSRQLCKVKAKMTSPDGTVVEMTAEWSRDE